MQANTRLETKIPGNASASCRGHINAPAGERMAVYNEKARRQPKIPGNTSLSCRG
jgi:hypothetical protein